MKHLKNTHTTRRGWASRGAKDPRYWLEMAFSGWQPSDRILGVYGIVPCCLGTPVLYRRKTYHWSMGGSFEESGCWQVCHAWNGTGSHQKHLRKKHEHLQLSYTKKATKSEGPLLHKILQYIMAHSPKEILPKATPCLYLDFFQSTDVVSSRTSNCKKSQHSCIYHISIYIISQKYTIFFAIFLS